MLLTSIELRDYCVSTIEMQADWRRVPQGQWPRENTRRGQDSSWGVMMSIPIRIRRGKRCAALLSRAERTPLERPSKVRT